MKKSPENRGFAFACVRQRLIDMLSAFVYKNIITTQPMQTHTIRLSVFNRDTQYVIQGESV